MRIGVLTGTFHPEAGGLATYVYHLLPDLQARGHEVRLLTIAEQGGTDTQTYGYPVTRIRRDQSGPARNWQVQQALRPMAAWSDALLAVGFSRPLLLLRPFGPIGRKPLALKIDSDYSWEYADRHGLTPLDVNAFQTARLPAKLDLIRRLHRASVRRADHVFTPSEHVKRLVLGWGVPAERVSVIYNAIPDSDLHSADRAALRRELGLPLDAPLLASVARLTPVKGVDVALHALPQVPGAHFVVVGDGPQQAELEALAVSLGVAERVRFVGRKEHADVLRIMRAADVFVLSSRTEGLSHVLLESLLVGTPAVATAVGGNPEVLTHETDGLLVPTEDPAALAAAIQQVLHAPGLADRLAAAGRKRSADFRWETLLDRTEALLIG